MEVWKSLDFLGYPKYKISNKGNLIGPYGPRKKIHNYAGYCVVDMYQEGKGKQFMLHILVALAFIPNPNKLPKVNHKDGNKDNCEDSNLEWITPQGNTEHAIKTGLMPIHGESNPNAILTQQQVDYIRSHPEKSLQTLAREFGVHSTTVCKVRRNATWKD